MTDGGGAYRKNMCRESKIYEMYGRFIIPILDTDKFIPSTTENSWEFVLRMAKSKFVIVKESKVAENFKLKLHGASLHLKKMKLTTPALQRISGEIRGAGGFLTYPILDRELFTYSLLEGTSARTTAETTLRAYPLRLYIFMSKL